MEILSPIEQRLYDYIKEKGEVTFESIKKDLGEKYLGASGKLIQKDLVERAKKMMEEEQKTGYARFGKKCVKTLKIKEAK